MVAVAGIGKARLLSIYGESDHIRLAKERLMTKSYTQKKGGWSNIGRDFLVSDNS